MNALNARLAAVTIAELPPTFRIALRVAEPGPAGIVIGLVLPARIG
ncbi:sarcosine oxidase subunit gamma, partial [Amaricoccus sp. HAR-UPW-R2A-40]